MKARVLFVSDLHKRDVDFSTIQGYTRAVDQVQADIMQFVKDHGITHLVSMGDWYDKGYRSINRYSNDRNLDEALSACVNGNFYICLGNHFFLERDNNPEMYLIQPSEQHTPTHRIYTADRPIIQAPDFIQIGGVRISLFHYSKANKFYHDNIDDTVKYHIGVYHDDVVVPSYAKTEGGHWGGSPSTSIEDMLSNVNFAIVGHLHKPVGAIKIPVNGREIPMLIPGSLANTQNGPSYHESVKLPVIEIGDDDSVACKLYQFSLHCEMLRLYKKKESAIKALIPDQAVMDLPKTVSVGDYLRARGFQEHHVKLVSEAAERQLDPLTGLRILGIVKGGKKPDA